jgi:hypothetical protein
VTQRRIISLDGKAPSPLWVRVHGPKPRDWQERLLAYSCREGAREQLVALDHVADAGNVRTRYLIGALEALRKLGFTIERWLDALDATGDADEPDPLWRRGLADEQSARQRLAWEMLVELIGFCGTDAPDYWLHHAGLTRLNRCAAQLADTETFFSCRPASLEAELVAMAEKVMASEQALGETLENCWYARRRAPATVDKIARNGLGALSSQRARLRHVLQGATQTERLALGVSYQRLYSRLSRRVHFSTDGPEHVDEPDAARGHGDGEVSVDDLRWGALVVARLGGLCLARVQQLTGLDGGAVCHLHRESRENLEADPHSDIHDSIVAGNIQIGDFAMVGRQLAVVRDRKANDLGYSRYLVEYVSESPAPEIRSEWMPATDVHTIWDRAKVEGWMEEALLKLDDHRRQVFIELEPDQRLLTYIRLAWELNLRGQVLGMLDNDPPAEFA